MISKTEIRIGHPRFMVSLLFIEILVLCAPLIVVLLTSQVNVDYNRREDFATERFYGQITHP